MNAPDLESGWFRQLAARTSHPVGIATPSDRRLLYANDALRELIGITPDTAIEGWTLDDFLPQYEATRLRAEVLPQVLAEGTWDGEFVVTSGGGLPRQTLRNIFALRDAQGAAVAIACVFTDVSVQKAHELDLTRANQLLGAVFEFTDLLVAYLDPDMNFLMVNRAYAQADGRQPDDLIGRNHFDFYPDAENEAIFREVARTGRPYHALARPFEYACNPERGFSYWDWSLIPTLDTEGRVTGLVLTLLNVTERQQMEAALRERDAHLERFKTTLDLALDSVFMFDADDLRIFYANHGACDHVGLDADQLHGMHPYDLKPDYPEARFRELIEPLQQGQQTSLTFETVHQHSDGDTIPVEVFLQRIAPDGEAARFVAIVRDIRERVAARETLRRNERELQRLNQSLEAEVAARTRELERENRRNQAILQSTPEGFFAIDTDGAIRAVNPAFCHMLGYHAAELLEMSLVDIEASETPDEIAAHMERVGTRGHDRFDTRHRRRDGRVIDVEVSVTRVDFDHQPMFYAFARDITWRKELEGALVRSRDLAEQASAAKSEFLSRMSHELRTPLNAILGFSELLAQDPREPPSPTQRDEIEEIHSAGKHLLALVNEVLDLARIESGRLEVRPEPMELEPLVQTCLVQLQAVLNERDLATQVDLNAAGPVHADPLRLRQILTNLLTNAAKYNRQGGTVRIDCAAAGGHALAVRVHDTGPGIAADDIPRVFLPFERLEASADNAEGSGIGLALTRRLVEAMGGRIGVESVPGDGSCFWFELPLADIAPEAPDPGPADSTLESTATTVQQRVLYVEDNPANLRLVQRILETRPGFHLLQAPDGETGLELARTHRPDLILMDLHLPGIDGVEALRALRADAITREIPVIAVSANAMPRDLEMGRSAGFADYVTKPIQIGAFLELLERHLAEPKQKT